MSTEEVAARVDAAAAAVDGVTRVFPVGQPAVRAARRAFGGSVPLSDVREVAGALQVDVSIGVEGDPEEIGRRVSDAVRATVAEHPGAAVRVRISRVR